MSDDARGPTVWEASMSRIAEINRKIVELNAEKHMLKTRCEKYRNSKMDEAERIATDAEPFQRYQLGESHE